MGFKHFQGVHYSLFVLLERAEYHQSSAKDDLYGASAPSVPFESA